MINKKQVTKTSQNNNQANTKLWQSVSEEEQNALKGGWGYKWPPFGGGGGLASAPGRGLASAPGLENNPNY